jgi:2-hydroxychromene-2-carboxylate isomerase
VTIRFYYDFNSPYAYLAASRVDAILPEPPRWTPVALAFLLRAHNRLPWSMVEETREPGMRDCERRAERYGLPPLAWPPGWPVESYSLAALRAAWIAAEHGLLREFSQAAFARNFVAGTGLRQLEDVVSVAASVGLDAERVRAGLESAQVKEQLRLATDEALALGVVGVPTVARDDQLFWGDDQLEAAARAFG